MSQPSSFSVNSLWVPFHLMLSGMATWNPLNVRRLEMAPLACSLSNARLTVFSLHFKDFAMLGTGISPKEPWPTAFRLDKRFKK